MPLKKTGPPNPSRRKNKDKKGGSKKMPEEYEEQRTTAIRMHPQPLKKRVKKSSRSVKSGKK